MLIFRMAYFNLWRRKARTIAVISMITAGLVGLLFTQGIYRGFIYQMIDDALRYTGDITIHGKGYRQSKRLTDSIHMPDTVLEALSEVPGVTRVSKRLTQGGMAASARVSRPVQLTGVDPVAEKEFGRLGLFIDEGEFSLEPGTRSAVIGAGLAKDLKIKLGRKVVVTAQMNDKSLTSVALRIRGIIRVNNPSIDKESILMNMSDLRSLLGIADNRVTQISVRLENTANLEKARDTLLQKLQLQMNDLEIFTWKDLYPLYVMSIDMIWIIEAISYFIIYLMVALAIFDILLVSVLERIREFGILLAVGTPFRTFRNLILLEAMSIGFLGFVFGSLFGYALLLYLKYFGLDLSNYADALGGIGMSSVIRAEVHWFYFLNGMAATFAATFLSALVPIRILKKLKPVEAIRFT